MIQIKLAYYRKKDWERFLNIIVDRERMHDSWQDWHEAVVKIRRDLESQGFEVVYIVVDLDELIEYCKLRGLKNDGKTRSHYVQTK